MSDPWTDADVDDLQWAMWFARKAKGTVREVAVRALEQNPALRFSEREAEAIVDVERLAVALAATKGIEPDDIVETTDGDVSALDYPDEWFETPRELARQIAADLYRHRVPELSRAAAERMQEALG